MKYVVFFFIAFSITITSSFAQTIEAEKPQQTVNQYNLDSLPLSEIDIPIQISLKPVYAMAEKNVDLVFTSPNYPNDWVQAGCDTRYKYSFRRSYLQLNGKDNMMNLWFTGYYKIIGSTRACISGTAVSPWTPACKCGFDEPERKVNVSFTNYFTLYPDYKVKLTINRNAPKPLDKCEVCFWGQDITKQVLSGLTAELDAAKAELDKNFGNIDLKPQFQQVWDLLNKPFGVYGMGWLQVNPEKIRVNSLFVKGDSLHINLGLSARPVVQLDKPKDKTSWVPNIAKFTDHKGFNIYTDAILNYDSLSNILTQQIKGQEFAFKKGIIKKRFVFNSCKVIGTDKEKLLLEVKFSGTDKGTIYMKGTPVYDKATRKLEIADIDFDIKTRDALLKGADWLFNKRITSEITKFAQYDLGTLIDSSKQTIDAQLNQEWVKGVRTEGKIKNVELIAIYPMSNQLIVRANCNGDLAVKVESIDFTM